ncbi:MAG: hypothetical protein CMR00_02485 [[Chlorobium] sp. 445]|nr:MAG: hypothetical protein CMR00_02485 [[Chlorobium] sp. 445]
MSQQFPEDALHNPDYIAVQPSPIQGYGIFTLKACQQGEIIMVIDGEVIDADECMRREAEEDNVYIFYLDEHRYLDTAQSGKIRYINHSCEPNALVVERDANSLYLVAARHIQAGEELTIDYDFEDIYDLCQRYNPVCKARLGLCTALQARQASQPDE